MPRYNRKRVPAGSPRMESAQQRAQSAREGKMGGAEAAAERKRRTRMRKLFSPLAGIVPFQR